ncbi:MAG: hypothetical protein Q9168_006653 [Polycauliona sp. 1 TL-2023]
MSYRPTNHRPRSRLGAAVHSFFHPDEAYHLNRRATSAERDADNYAHSARNSEERALSAERDCRDAEHDADYNARLYDREHHRRAQIQRSAHGYGRQLAQRGYGMGYRDGSADMHEVGRGQRRVGTQQRPPFF